MTQWTDGERLNVEQAANGCISGKLAEWPLVFSALKKSGVTVYGDTSAIPARELCKLLLEIDRLRASHADLEKWVRARIEDATTRGNEAARERFFHLTDSLAGQRSAYESVLSRITKGET